MLLHELSTKRLATCERSVIGTDIPGIPASIALYELRKALARQTQWLPVIRKYSVKQSVAPRNTRDVGRPARSWRARHPLRTSDGVILSWD